MITIKKHVWLTSLLLGMVAAVMLATPVQAGKSKEAIELEGHAKASLAKLYAANGKARHVRTKAKAVLTFPRWDPSWHWGTYGYEGENAWLL